MIGDFIFEYFGWFVFVFFALLCSLVWISVYDEVEKREHFMEQCKQERKEYECVSMWRDGDAHNTYVPIVIPMR